MESLRGKLLIAGPGLWDPRFRRTVVLIGQHDEQDGAVGVILNRALELSVEEAIPDLSQVVPPGEPIFEGGPVQPQAAIIVADFDDPAQVDVLAFDSVGFVPPEIDPQTAVVRRARVFAGYAGWGPGQLEAELVEDGSWLIEPALADDVFCHDPERLWEQVVARKGSDFALLRSMPEDPSLN
ncbi:MAG: YqgE/AlgH family protein [Actinomycetota bacterium]